MSCCGDREKGPPEHTQKWDFIPLSDFKSTSAWTPLAYGWLWFMAIVAIAVYTVDTFTAVNLLAFDKWNSQIKPAIPLTYSKWIFAACILLSWALCIFEWLRAARVMRRGGVAESYMDPLAVTLQSMHPQGWRRFLVFTELTKSKKGADYVAFFVYFAFKGAIRVILAEGPRQFVNAVTLYAVMNADLVVHGTPTDHHSSFEQFFLNLEGLAEKNVEQSVILMSMLFTLVIWVFSALCLILATVLYLVFLWHYIPQVDGRLSIYCRRKIDRRLEKIVEHKVKAAIEEEERKKKKAEEKAELKRQKTGEVPPLKDSALRQKLERQPTLPQLGEHEEPKREDGKLPDFPLARHDTNTSIATLPRYESRPPTQGGSQPSLQRQPTLPDMNARPSMASRQTTQGSSFSNASYASDAPLLANAGYAGEIGRSSPAPSMPGRQGSNASYGRPPPSRMPSNGSFGAPRSGTPMSRMDTVGSQQRPFSPMSRMDTVGSQQRPFSPVSRMDTVGSQQGPYSPMSANSSMRGPPGQRFPVRSNTNFSYTSEPQSVTSPLSPADSYNRPYSPAPHQNAQDGYFPSAMSRNQSGASNTSRPYPAAHLERRPTYGSPNGQQASFSRPFSPGRQDSRRADPGDSYEMSTQPPTAYVPFRPAQPPALQTAPNEVLRRNPTIGGAYHHTEPVRDVPQRSATAPIDPRHTLGYADIISDYDEPSAPSSITPLSIPQEQHASSVYSQPQFPSPAQTRGSSPAHFDESSDDFVMPHMPGGAQLSIEGKSDSWMGGPQNRF